MIIYTIKKEEENQRIDKYIRKKLKNAPLSFIYKLFRKKDIKVNNKHVDINYLVKDSDEIKLYISNEQYESFKNQINFKIIKFPYEIIYEDNNILIINKPAGLLIHGDNKNKKETLTNYVINYLYSKNEINSINDFIPSPAHRLDRNTSGLVIFGKNNEVLHELMNLLKEKINIKKYYIAIVCGNINKDGVIEQNLLKINKTNTVIPSNDETSKVAITKYKVIKNLKYATLVEIELITGRTHQIRAHFKYINHPLIGDNKYGNIQINKIYKDKYNINYQLLCAYKIKFNKIDGILSNLSNKTFQIEYPKIFKEIINN